jgi:chromosome segregation ATPase
MSDTLSKLNKIQETYFDALRLEYNDIDTRIQEHKDEIARIRTILRAEIDELAERKKVIERQLAYTDALMNGKQTSKPNKPRNSSARDGKSSKPRNMNMQQDILDCLGRKTMTPTELERMLGRGKNQLSGTLGRMIRNGLLVQPAYGKYKRA